MRDSHKPASREDDDLHPELIDAYCAGRLTPAEHAHVARWIARDPERRAILQGLRRGLAARDDLAAQARYETAAQRVTHNVFSTTSQGLRSSRDTSSLGAGSLRGKTSLGTQTLRPRRNRAGTRHIAPVGERLRIFFGVAAMILLLAIGVVIHAAHEPGRAEQRFQTASGQHSTVRLQDGSTMLLAPRTAVTIAMHTITVSGEVYFTVAPHSSRPFIVRTNDAVVRVLGTRFSVRKYPDDGSSRIVVEEGRVALQELRVNHQSGFSSIISSRMVAFITDSGITITPGIATHDYTTWTQGTLIFNHVPLYDVVLDLSCVYGIDVHVTDSALARQKIIAEVEVRQKPLTQILDAISVMMNAHYVWAGNAYILSQGRKERSLPAGQLQRNNFPQPEKQYGR